MKDFKITTKEQYNKSLEWLVEKANQIAELHPLTPEAEKVKLNKLYDIVSKELDIYLTNLHASKDPQIKEIYQELGLIPVEHEQLKLESQVVESPPLEQDPPKQQIDVNAWIG